MATTIQNRRDTLANWTSVNPVPAAGEFCLETDSGKVKIGNGTSTYTALPYIDTDTTYSIQDGELSEINFTAADHTKLDGIESSADVTDTTNVVAALTAGSNVTIASDGTISAAGGSGTVNMTDAEIRAAVEAATDSNVFTDADHTKLDGIEDSADVTDTTNVVAALTAGSNITIANDGTISSTASGGSGSMTDSEVKTAYENNADTNAFTDADHTKLDGLDATAYATTAQGTTADAALPKAGGTMTGDIDGDGNKVLFANMYDNLVDLPSASTYHGMFAHVHATEKAYYAHAGSWVELANADITDENFTTADHTKLDGIEAAADVTDTDNVVAALTAGSNITIAADGTIASTATGGSAMTDAEVKTAYENNADTNAFTDAEQTKLTGIDADADVNPAQVSAGEIATPTETDLRSYSPKDLEDIIDAHAPVFSYVETTTTTASTATNFGEQDLTSGTWGLNSEAGTFFHSNGFGLATVTETTGSTDSDGFQFYNVADTASSGSGQTAWEMIGIDVSSLMSDGQTVDLTFEILKSSLTKPGVLMTGTSGGGNFTAQGLLEFKSDGTASITNNDGRMPGTVTVVDTGNTWEYTFSLNKTTTDLHFGVVPVLRATDNGGYDANATGSIEMSPLRIKGTGGGGGGTTTTSTTTVTKLQGKHVLPTHTDYVEGSASAINSNDVAFAIVMGQSNAAGTNNTAPTTASISNVYTQAAGTFTFQAYDDTDNNSYTTQGVGNSNPLTELAREWQVRHDANPTTTPDLYVINISRGGTGFTWDITSSSQWDPFCRRAGVAGFYTMPVAGSVTANTSLFYCAQKAIKEALLQFAKEGKRAFHIGTVWSQWELDSTNQDATDRYPANLTLIRNMVDEALGIDDADFYTWRPIWANGSRTPQMQKTFDNFVENNDNCFHIDARDFDNYTGDATGPNFGVFESDNLHFNQASQENGAKVVLDNSWFKEDANGNPTRRAREVTMSVKDMMGTTRISDDGTLYDMQVTDAGALDTVLTTNQPD